MMLLPRPFIFLPVLFLYTKTAFSQNPGSKAYPQQYFTWPVGAKVGLAANFGELRPNHYHMGLDCKTDQRTNLPVYAAADGFVSRVKIEPFGFGRSISIDHPNGYTTLYAHLNDFYPALEKYIKEQQYKLQKWDVTISIPENIFPVKKGDFIAYSGNTGGSQGPHLHFEIRETKTEKVLNPLLFGFPIPDAIPPVILRLAVYDRRLGTYEQIPRIYPLKKINGVFKPSVPVMVSSDKVSFAITAYDRYTGSTNQNGIYMAELSDDGKPACSFKMDNISYDETRYLNAHIDYKTRSNGGPFLEHLSRLPGYTNGIYDTGDGVIDLPDENPHNISIRVTDANGNYSLLECSVRRSGLSGVKAEGGNELFFHPGSVNIFDNDRVRLYLQENLLYDSFHFKYAETKPLSGNTIYQLHNTSVPVHGYFPVWIRADFPVSDTGKIIMKRFSGHKKDYKKATNENGWYRAMFREFGSFQLMTDTIAPEIIPVGFRNGMNVSKIHSIRFTVLDETEDIKNFTGLLDGSWIRFSNDKGRTFVYDIDEHCSAGTHELEVVAEDMAGNKTTRKYQFIR